MSSSIQLDFELFSTAAGFQRHGEVLGENARLDDPDVPFYTTRDVSRSLRRVRRFNYLPLRMIQATEPPVKILVGNEKQADDEYDYRIYGIECAHPDLRQLELRPTTTVFGETRPSRRNGPGGLVMIPYLNPQYSLSTPLTGYFADVDTTTVVGGVLQTLALLTSTGMFFDQLNGIMGAYYFLREMGFGRLQETLLYEGANLGDWILQTLQSINPQAFLKAILDRLLNFLDDTARQIISYVLTGVLAVGALGALAVVPVAEAVNTVLAALFALLNDVTRSFELLDMEIGNVDDDSGMLGFVVPTWIFKKCPNGAHPSLSKHNIYRQFCDFCALDSYYLIGRGYGRMPDFVGVAIDLAMLSVSKKLAKGAKQTLKVAAKNTAKEMAADVAISATANAGKAGLPAFAAGSSYMHAHPRQMSIRLSVIYIAAQAYIIKEEVKLSALSGVIRAIGRIVGFLQEIFTVISYLEDSMPTNFHLAHWNDWITYSTHAKFQFESGTTFGGGDANPPEYMDPNQPNKWYVADGFFEVPHTLNVHNVDYFHQPGVVGAKYDDIAWLYSQPCKFRWGGTGDEREKNTQLFKSLKSLFPTGVMDHLLRWLFKRLGIDVEDWADAVQETAGNILLAALTMDIYALITALIISRDNTAVAQGAAKIDPAVPSYTMDVVEVDSVVKPEWYDKIEFIQVQVRSWDLYPHQESFLNSLWLSAQALSELDGVPARTAMNLVIYPELDYAHLYARHWWRKVIRLGHHAYRQGKLKNAAGNDVSLKRQRFHYHVPWRLTEAGARITYEKHLKPTFTNSRELGAVGMDVVLTNAKSKMIQKTTNDSLSSANLPGVVGWRVNTTTGFVELYGGVPEGCAFPPTGSILSVDMCNNDFDNLSFTVDGKDYGIQGLVLRVARRGGMWGYVGEDGRIASTEDGETNRELLGALDVAYCEVVEGTLPTSTDKIFINTKDVIWQRVQQARGAYAVPSVYSQKSSMSSRGGSSIQSRKALRGQPTAITAFNEDSEFSVTQLRLRRSLQPNTKGSQQLRLAQVTNIVIGWWITGTGVPDNTTIRSVDAAKQIVTLTKLLTEQAQGSYFASLGLGTRSYQVSSAAETKDAWEYGAHKLFWSVDGTRTDDDGESFFPFANMNGTRAGFVFAPSTLIPALISDVKGIKPHTSVREGESIFIKADDELGIPYGTCKVQYRNLHTGAWTDDITVVMTRQESTTEAEHNTGIAALTPRVSGPVRVGERVVNTVYYIPLEYAGDAHAHKWKLLPNNYDGGILPAHPVDEEEDWQQLSDIDKQRLVDADDGSNYIYVSFEEQRPDFDGRVPFEVLGKRFHRKQIAFARNLGRRHITTVESQDFVDFDNVKKGMDIHKLLSLSSRILVSTSERDLYDNQYLMEFNRRVLSQLSQPKGHGKFVNVLDTHGNENHGAPKHAWADFHDFYLWAAAIPAQEVTRLLTSLTEVTLANSSPTAVTTHQNSFRDVAALVRPSKVSVSYDEAIASGTCSMTASQLTQIAFGSRLSVTVNHTTLNNTMGSKPIVDTLTRLKSVTNSEHRSKVHDKKVKEIFARAYTRPPTWTATIEHDYRHASMFYTTSSLDTSTTSVVVHTDYVDNVGNVFAWIGSECVKITAHDSTTDTLTFTRAQRGTTATSHAEGTEIFVPPGFTNTMTCYRPVDPILTSRCAVVTIKANKRIQMSYDDFRRIDANIGTRFALYEAHTSINGTDYQIGTILPSADHVTIVLRSGTNGWATDKLWPCIMVVRGLPEF